MTAAFSVSSIKLFLATMAFIRLCSAPYLSDTAGAKSVQLGEQDFGIFFCLKGNRNNRRPSGQKQDRFRLRGELWRPGLGQIVRVNLDDVINRRVGARVPQ